MDEYPVQALRECPVEIDPPECEAQQEGEREHASSGDRTEAVEGVDELGEPLAEDDEDEQPSPLPQVIDPQE